MTIQSEFSKILKLKNIGLNVDLTHGFKPQVATEALGILFERLAYFQCVREIGHHTIRGRRRPKDKKLNRLVKWTNATQNRQVFTRVMALIKMENKWKSVSEVATLCNITPKAVRTMIEDADKLGMLERCPDTHYVRANDYSMGVWYTYVEALYNKDEEFMLAFFNVVYRFYEGKKLCEKANFGEVTSLLLDKLRT